MLNLAFIIFGQGTSRRIYQRQVDQMRQKSRKYGKATSTITDPVTGEVLGWEYRWDNGQESRIMKASDPWGMMTAAELSAWPGVH